MKNEAQRQRTITYIEEMLHQLDDRRLRLVYAFVLHILR